MIPNWPWAWPRWNCTTSYKFSVSVKKMGEGWTEGASDIVKAKSSGEDPRATGGLVSNLPHPRVNKTKQHLSKSKLYKKQDRSPQPPPRHCHDDCIIRRRPPPMHNLHPLRHMAREAQGLQHLLWSPHGGVWFGWKHRAQGVWWEAHEPRARGHSRLCDPQVASPSTQHSKCLALLDETEPDDYETYPFNLPGWVSGFVSLDANVR